MKKNKKDFTKEQIKIIKEIDQAYKSHDTKKCKVDCCIFCYSDQKEKK